MDMFEEARSLVGTMRMCRLTQSELAKRLGVSQAYVANKLRLLSYSEELQKRILDARLTERHARAVLRLKGDAERSRAIEKIIEGGLTVRESEALIDGMYDEYMPIIIKNTESLERIEAFMQLLRGSVKTLQSLGINARENIDFYGKKTYITIAIDEG